MIHGHWVKVYGLCIIVAFAFSFVRLLWRETQSAKLSSFAEVSIYCVRFESMQS